MYVRTTSNEEAFESETAKKRPRASRSTLPHFKACDLKIPTAFHSVVNKNLQLTIHSECVQITVSSKAADLRLQIMSGTAQASRIY